MLDQQKWSRRIHHHQQAVPGLCRTALHGGFLVLFLVAATLPLGCAPREELARPLIRVDVTRDGKPVAGAPVYACSNLDTSVETGCKRLDEEVTDAEGAVSFGSFEDITWGMWCPADFYESHTVVLSCKDGLIDAFVLFGKESTEATLELGALGTLEVEELGERRMDQYEESGVQRLAAEVCDFDQ